MPTAKSAHTQQTALALILRYKNEYESYSPLGPLVDNKGNLLFFDPRNGKTIFDGKSFKRFQAETENAYIDSISFMNDVSSNGIAVNQSMQVYTFRNNYCQLNIFPEDKEYPKSYILFNNSILFIEEEMEDSFMLSFEGNSIKDIPYKDFEVWLNNHNFEF